MTRKTKDDGDETCDACDGAKPVHFLVIELALDNDCSEQESWWLCRPCSDEARAFTTQCQTTTQLDPKAHLPNGFALVTLEPFDPLCTGCNCEAFQCRSLWRSQRKCCPDCSHFLQEWVFCAGHAEELADYLNSDRLDGAKPPQCPSSLN